MHLPHAQVGTALDSLELIWREKCASVGRMGMVTLIAQSHTMIGGAAL